MSNRKEFGKRCELCHKNRESHMYPFLVSGKYLRLCSECWDIMGKALNKVLVKTVGGLVPVENITSNHKVLCR